MTAADVAAGLRDEAVMLEEERGEIRAAADRELLHFLTTMRALDDQIVDFTAKGDDLRRRAAAAGEAVDVPSLPRLGGFPADPGQVIRGFARASWRES